MTKHLSEYYQNHYNLTLIHFDINNRCKLTRVKKNNKVYKVCRHILASIVVDICRWGCFPSWWLVLRFKFPTRLTVHSECQFAVTGLIVHMLLHLPYICSEPRNRILKNCVAYVQCDRQAITTKTVLQTIVLQTCVLNGKDFH